MITKYGITTPQAISKAYIVKISKMESVEDPSEIVDTLFQDRFMRIGVILHKLNVNHDHSENLKNLLKDEKSFKKKNPGFTHVECFPTRIIEIKNPQIQEHFYQWILSVHVMTQV